ncbi:MAG: hypothetical protein ACYTHM_23550 [Planctomycetota bacterium]|jgi:hypothetical protein
MNRILMGIIALLALGTEAAFAHGGGHPTPAPPPPSTNPPPSTTPPSPAITPPGYIVVPPSSSTGNFVVYWGPVSGATGYELEEDNRVGFPNPFRYPLAPTTTAVQLNGRPNGTWVYRVRTVVNGVFSNWCTGTNGCVVFIRGTLSLGIGSASPGSILQNPGDQGIVVLQLSVSANAVENITVNGMTVQSLGSLDDASAIGAINVYRDGNGNGQLDAGQDPLLAGPESFASDDGSVTFSLNRTIQAGASELWLVTVDLVLGAWAGFFRVEIPSSQQVSVTGSVAGNNTIVVGPPLRGGLLTVGNPPPVPGPTPPPTPVLGTLRVTLGPGNPDNGTVPCGSAGHEVLHLALQTGPGEPVRIDNIVLTHFGTMREPNESIGYSLHADTNGNYILDEEDRLVRGPVPAVPGSANVLFLALGEAIPASSRVIWFVTATVSKEVAVGGTLGVNLDSGHLLSVRGMNSQATIPVEGLPILGAEMTVSEAEPPPSPPARASYCGGSPSATVPPEGVFGLVLLLLAFIATLRYRSRHRVTMYINKPVARDRVLG